MFDFFLLIDVKVLLFMLDPPVIINFRYLSPGEQVSKRSIIANPGLDMSSLPVQALAELGLADLTCIP